MENELTELIGAIMGELKEVSKTETIVGEPVSLGEKMIVPVTKMSLGFAVGGGEGKAQEKGTSFGGAGGGGAKVEPMGFIVIQEDNVSFLPTKPDKFEGLIDAIPGIINKVKDIIPDKNKGKEKREKKSNEQ